MTVQGQISRYYKIEYGIVVGENGCFPTPERDRKRKYQYQKGSLDNVCALEVSLGERFHVSACCNSGQSRVISTPVIIVMDAMKLPAP